MSSIPTGQFPTLEQTIANLEGYFPGSLAYSNNNPGNLMYAGQPGAIGADANGFAVFPDPASGVQALDNQLQLDASRGLTIGQFAQKYSPNAPANYAPTLANAAGLPLNAPLSSALQSTGSSLNTAIPGAFPEPSGTSVNTMGVPGSQPTTGSPWNPFGLSASRISAFVVGLILISAGLILFAAQEVVPRSLSLVSKTKGTLGSVASLAA